MNDQDSIFSAARGNAPVSPPQRLPTFTPFVVLAGILVVVWAFLAFVLPAPHHDTPARTIMQKLVFGS
ncbi:hypothetical protein [Acetobacter fallax]|uniref:Uncharacterized protein n=1 Tax=Acetobacter fallax TaxID=1737473 RepID=A0ABX0KF16_9PROT|nr:hypothetical protein [Acetobacter fallax]NHO32522.1 hypothetical protein [Acetobacter fallax]NHO36134.1 hypothetical protein [Acetobacter fallax]